ncbi:hypothetical protein BDL97_13G048600 [Sphagnum fallax]|nr:hypothetical protein BDL97_13G048600 [Sphagnum fallax]
MATSGAAAASELAGHGDNVEFNWEERFQALVQNWSWIDYIVVWKLNPHTPALVWHRGYFNDRSSSFHPEYSRRIAPIFSSIYRSCVFRSSNSGYAARAVYEQAPLWWTSNQPRLPTDERKDQFLQELGIKTIVCLPGLGTDGNMYCLELASTQLKQESSGMLQALLAFASGSREQQLLAAGLDEEELAVAQQQQENIQLESVSTPSSDAEAAGGVPTDMMLNLWASMSDIDDAQMQMSSFMQRSTLDSLVMAHDIMQIGQPPAAAAATMFGTTTQYPAMPVSATPAFHNVLPYHQLPGQHQSASTPYQRMETPELSAASTTALEAAPSSSMNRLQAAGLPLAPADPSSHVRQGMLAQLAGDTRMPPAGSARAVDQQLGNPSESTVRSRAAAVSLHSPFKSFEPISRHPKLRRLDDSRDTGNIAGPSKPRQPMIELWIKDLCPRIQESDRMKRRLQLGATVAGSSMNPAGAAGGSFMQGDTHVSADQQYYSPGWIEEQAQIAQKHMLAERDRRFKFKEKIHTLCSIVPTTKKDNLSVLTNTIDYIRRLKEQIAGLEMAGSTSTAAASTHDPAVLQAPAVTSSAGPSSSTAAAELAQAQQQLRSEAAAAATTHPSSSSINNTTTVAVSWRQFELAGTEAAGAHGAMRAGTNTGISSNAAGQLVIEVETPYNNPQSLIQVLSVVQDLGLDLDSLSSGNLNNGRMQISVRVLRRSTSRSKCSQTRQRNYFIQRLLGPSVQKTNLKTSFFTKNLSFHIRRRIL